MAKPKVALGLIGVSLSALLYHPSGVASQGTSPPGETRAPLRYASGESTGRHGPYLGEEPPGLTPKLFAPGIISSAGHYEMDLSFSRDGRECYIGRDGQMLVSTLEADGWTAPQLAPFRFERFGPMVVTPPSGQLMILSSSDGLSVSWKVEGGWTRPEFLMRGMGKSITDAGTVYTSWFHEPVGGWRLFRARLSGGRFGEPELVSLDVEATHPQVAPDESFILFESNLPGGYGDRDYYVTFRKDDRTWSEPVNLGPAVNSPDQNARARLTPDGRYILFNRFGDIYWVAVEYLDALRSR